VTEDDFANAAGAKTVMEERLPDPTLPLGSVWLRFVSLSNEYLAKKKEWRENNKERKRKTNAEWEKRNEVKVKKEKAIRSHKRREIIRSVGNLSSCIGAVCCNATNLA
jgi:hypothetical protein